MGICPVLKGLRMGWDGSMEPFQGLMFVDFKKTELNMKFFF